MAGTGSRPRSRTRACVLALLALAWAPGAAAQGFYRYMDDRGVVHFTNVSPEDPRFQAARMTPGGVQVGPNLEAVPPIHHGFDHLIRSAARAYDVQPALVKAVIAAESLFDPTAVSHKGAIGLMQLMPFTADALGVEDPYEPSANVLGGTRYLREMLSRYGDVSRALAAYNAGPRAVDRYRGIPPYRETQAYVSRVLHYYRRYDQEFSP